jgi:hypothetical protein
MKKIFIIVLSVFILTSCMSTDPLLVSGVNRSGDGVYTTIGSGFDDPSVVAVKQCQMDGGVLEVLASTTTVGGLYFSGFPKLIFSCNKK